MVGRPASTPSRTPTNTATQLFELVLQLVEPAFRRWMREELIEFTAGDHGAPSDLLTIEDAMREWQCSRSTIDTLRKEGLPTVVIGSSPRFQRGECLRWFSERARPRPEAAE